MHRTERRVVDLRHAGGDPYRRAMAVVRNFRRVRNWTQALAAEWYGVSKRTWRRYEAGDVEVPRPLRRRIESWRDRTATGAEHRAYLTF